MEAGGLEITGIQWALLARAGGIHDEEVVHGRLGGTAGGRARRLKSNAFKDSIICGSPILHWYYTTV